MKGKQEGANYGCRYRDSTPDTVICDSKSRGIRVCGGCNGGEGKEQVLRLITPGHTFNDVPALDGGPNPASAAAMEPSVVYMMRRIDLKKLILERPAVAEAVTRTLAGALRHMVALVEDLSFRHVTSRVAKILLDQEREAQKGQVVHRLTQQEMAALVGSAREVVGRSLKELEASGAIDLRQGRVTVLDQGRLSMFL